jgi:rare lipoprotein A
MRLTLALLLFALSGTAHAESGIASIYGNGDGYAGKCVARQRPGGGCERMDPRAMTAAHRTLPFGTRVTVVNQRNGRQIVVTINDRGPFIRGRIIDLTPAGAAALDFDGLAPVSVH